MTTKSELIANVAGHTGLSKSDVGRVVDAVLAEITAAEKVRLTGFGTFARKQRAARTMRDPRTGALINVPARSVLTFKASKGVV